MVSEIAPLLVDMVATRKSNSRMVSTALADNAWMSDIPGDIDLQRASQMHQPLDLHPGYVLRHC